MKELKSVSHITLFIIPKLWKQPKCPLRDDWLKKMWYIHTMEYPAIKKRRKSCYLLQHR